MPDPPSIKRDTDVTLAEANATSATFVVETRYDPESMRAVLRDLAKLGPPGKRRQPDEDLTGMVDQATYTVPRLSGLTRSYRRTTTASAVAGAEGQTITLELQ